jgi:hypothetical protein
LDAESEHQQRRHAWNEPVDLSLLPLSGAWLIAAHTAWPPLLRRAGAALIAISSASAVFWYVPRTMQALRNGGPAVLLRASDAAFLYLPNPPGSTEVDLHATSRMIAEQIGLDDGVVAGRWQLAPSDAPLTVHVEAGEHVGVLVRPP